MSHSQPPCPHFTPGELSPEQPPQHLLPLSPGQTGPQNNGLCLDVTNNPPAPQLPCSACDHTNKASTADFNRWLIVIFALQLREMGTIFSTLHLIDTASPFVFCFQLQAIKAFLASHNNCIKRPLHNHTITLFIALPSPVSFIWL